MAVNNYLDIMCILAQEAHKGQMYGKEPYTFHLLAVRSRVEKMMLFYTDHFLKLDGNVNELKIIRYLACAVGHDIIEDTPWTVQNLYDAGFPDDIVVGIDGVSKREGEPYQDYISRVCSNPMSLFIKVADSYCNMKQNELDCNTKRFDKYKKQYDMLLGKLDRMMDIYYK